ncbi:hypothetical protein H4219_001778 [Mycoemilia scoparia]|uniref:Uncharacterized protein n=1 Tax=Mycoemilia scoparia TaxID=417184 RepID=A0A9W7ZZC0_9FUNG|nr:hypothetical protein H4219_001778 [Mycoemilia scoparia]
MGGQNHLDKDISVDNSGSSHEINQRPEQLLNDVFNIEPQRQTELWEKRLLGKYVIDDRRYDDGNEKKYREKGIKDTETIKTSELVSDPEFKNDGLYEIRVLYPGQPVTRDLRLSRMNLFVDENGKVRSISFH